jgi:hypothetical protein
MTVKIKKKLTRSHPGLAGWTESRVDRVSPGQFPSRFLPQPGLVPGPGRPGLGSTHRAGPGFKTLIEILLLPCPSSLKVKTQNMLR